MPRNPRPNRSRSKPDRWARWPLRLSLRNSALDRLAGGESLVGIAVALG